MLKKKGINRNSISLSEPACHSLDLKCTSFVLHVGNSAWYKNRKSVIKAFLILIKKFHRKDLHLILVGNAPTEEETATLSVDEKSLLFKKTKIFTNLSDPEVNFLYGRARALLFPSLIEGFGWPPLEAQSFGCPVIASSAGSLSEILSDSALIINPNDTDELASQTLRILENKDLADKFIQKGLNNVTRFPFEETVNKYIKLYHDILACKN